MADSPVRDVPFGEALNISLDNYYDLLKSQVGGLRADEFLQLKLVADTVDVSDENYKFWSYYNLVIRSDQAIEPTPVSDGVMTGAETLVDEYDRFIRQLRTYVVREVLSDDDFRKLADIDLRIRRLKKERRDLRMEELAYWRVYCELTGVDNGDQNHYHLWSTSDGNAIDLEDLRLQIITAEFEKLTILKKEYPNPEDKKIIQAEFDLMNPLMRLRYPTHPDHDYSDHENFSL